jgi:glutathione S-transferase
LGTNDKWSPEKLDVILEEAVLRSNISLEMLNEHLLDKQWLALGRPTIADVSVFPYVALAPEGKVSLEPYEAVRSWIERIKGLPGFVGMPGI